MARTLRNLARELTETSKQIDEKINALKVEVVLAVLTDLVNTTPVDTSKALSNWQVTLVEASAGQIDPYFYGSKGSTQETSAASALILARAILKNTKPEQSVWIQNKLPYIRKLNEGSSTQAPRGFVERSVLIGRNVVKSKRLF